MSIIGDIHMSSSEQGVDSSPHTNVDLHQVELHPSMADHVINKNDGESTNGSGSQQVEIFERPTGLRGLYYHPVTQVRIRAAACS